MPVKIDRIEFYAPPPPPNARLECEVLIRSLGQREVRSDITLWFEGAPYCFISLWEDWRFDTDDGSFAVMRQPEHHILAEVHPEGFVTLPAPDTSISALGILARRFLGAKGFEELNTLSHHRRQSEWLFGRIAAKDAVRSYLFDQGYGPIYPIELTIEHDPNGKPVVGGDTGRDMRVSIAHTDGMAAAIAAEGSDPGIDIERIAPRTERFAAIAFTPDELAKLPQSDHDEWLTRLWCAKEAAGKARGTGLQGTPRTLPLLDMKGARMLIDGTWVDTRRMGQYVIAWTVA
jgi:phosphopantetheinyl transferase